MNAWKENAYSSEVKFVRLSALPARLAVLVGLFLVAVSAGYGVRCFLGRTLAKYAVNERGAMLAAQIAPGDPFAHFALARFLERNSIDESSANAAMQNYEQAVRLSPSDYQLWLEVGAAREHNGDLNGAEQAFRQAAKLAPLYSAPRWELGNFLLRRGRRNEAFQELIFASNANFRLRPAVVDLAWQYSSRNAEEFLNLIHDDATRRQDSIDVFLSNHRLPEAFRIWSSEFTPEEKMLHREVGERLLEAEFAEQNYTAAFEIFRDIAGRSEIEAGRIIDGGFEQKIAAADKYPFGWKIKMADKQAHLANDHARAHSGKSSLLIDFSGSIAPNADILTQLVVVKPSTRYRLQGFARSEQFKSLNPLIIEVRDASQNNRILASTAPPVLGTQDWQSLNLTFSSTANTTAVTIAIKTPSCSEGACFIVGKVWYDDFSLEPLN